MKPLGTILPTVESLATNDRYAANIKKLQASVANTHPVLSKLVGLPVNGETRYYSSPFTYAVINKAGKVLWFQENRGTTFSI
jgi:hypothetical protein